MKALCLPSSITTIFRRGKFQTLPFTTSIDRLMSLLPAGVDAVESILYVEVRVDNNIAML